MRYLTDQQCNKEAVAVAFLKPSSGRGKRTVHSIHNNVADYHGKVKESYNTIIRGKLQHYNTRQKIIDVLGDAIDLE